MLVLADDLTGAIESAVLFSQRGISSQLQVGNCLPLRTNESQTIVTTIDIESRHLSELEAAALVWSHVRQQGAGLVYKKTDSTLRGNIFAELDALTQFESVFYVPAYPAMGRTVVNGRLHVGGIPIERTRFRDDPTHPVLDGDLSRLLRSHPRIFIQDATTEADMQRLAREWLNRGGYAAGPCGLLRAVAEIWATTELEIELPRFRRALVVCGSLHPCSCEQIRQGDRLFRSGEWTLLTTDPDILKDAKTVSADLTEQIISLLQISDFDALIVFGGETAKTVLDAIGVRRLKPLTEFLPGIPVCEMPDGRLLITKAGGFGPPDLLEQVYERFCCDGRQADRDYAGRPERSRPGNFSSDICNR